MNELADADIREIRERANAATPGPWEFVGGHSPTGEPIDRLVHIVDDDPELEPEQVDILFGEPESQTAANWDFVQHARQDVPRLLDEVERLRKQLGDVNAWLEFSSTHPEEHVAYLRFITKHDQPTRLQLCDSDAAGAFRVYRGPRVLEADNARLRERLAEIASTWAMKATDSREEAGRIRRTIKAPTDAEAYCNARAEVWDKCAAELRERLAVLEQNHE